MTVRHIVTRLHPDDKLDPDKTRPTGAKPGTMRQVSVNLRENPIDWLHARGQLSDRQRNAGERSRRDYERASLSSRVTMNWDNAARVSGQRRAAPSPPDLGASQIDAKRRFDGAIAAVGPGLSDICWRVGYLLENRVCGRGDGNGGKGVSAGRRDRGDWCSASHLIGWRISTA